MSVFPRFKTRQKAVDDWMATFFAVCEKVTSAAAGTVIRGIGEATGAEVGDMSSDLKAAHDGAFIDTATGAYLDGHGAENGATRFPSIKARGPLRFMGAALTVVPANTVVRRADGVGYKTLAAATTNGAGYADDVPAECQVAGVVGNAPSATILYFQGAPPAGITGVINLYAFVGGRDAETDGMFRQRILGRFDALSAGAPGSYAQWAVEACEKTCLFYDGSVPSCTVANPNFGGPCTDGTYIQCNQWNYAVRALRAYAQGRVAGPDTVRLHILTPGGALDAWVADIIDEYVAERAGLTTDYAVVAASFADIEVGVSVVPRAGYTVEQVRRNIENSLISLLDSSYWPWGQTVYFNDIDRQARAADGIRDLIISNPTGNVEMEPWELPRLARVYLTDMSNISLAG